MCLFGIEHEQLTSYNKNEQPNEMGERKRVHCVIWSRFSKSFMNLAVR